MSYLVEELKLKAPAVFRTAEEGAKNGASSKYLFIPTVDVIEDLSKFGWDIYDVAQQKSKTSPDTTRHLVRFRHKDFGAVGLNGNVPEILFTNSHDRTKSMNFHVGIFRLICSNGLVVADSTFSKLNVKHNTLLGHTLDNVRELINDVTTNLPVVFNNIKRFEETKLNEDKRRELVMKMFAVRYPDYLGKDGNVKMSEIEASTDVDKFLSVRRAEDAPDNLWCVFNRIQEKLMGGDYNHIGIDGKVRHARPIKNISLGLTINEGLWQVANSFMKPEPTFF
jgi:hypothetical protein